MLYIIYRRQEMTKQIIEKIDEDIGVVLSDMDDIMEKTILPKRNVGVRAGKKDEPSIVIFVK